MWFHSELRSETWRGSPKVGYVGLAPDQPNSRDSFFVVVYLIDIYQVHALNNVDWKAEYEQVIRITFKLLESVTTTKKLNESWTRFSWI